jgi:hypothetical protein
MQKYEKKDTAVCIFDKNSPRITAYEIQEWIYNSLHSEKEDVVTIQIDGPRQVFIKTTHSMVMEDLISRTKGESTYEYDSGETYKVISQAGLGRRNVRIANLPPEMPEYNKTTKKYGQVATIKKKNGQAYIGIM